MTTLTILCGIFLLTVTSIGFWYTEKRNKIRRRQNLKITALEQSVRWATILSGAVLFCYFVNVVVEYDYKYGHIQLDANGQVKNWNDVKKAFDRYPTRIIEAEAVVVSIERSPMGDHRATHVQVTNGHTYAILSSSGIAPVGTHLIVRGPTNDYGNFICVIPKHGPLP